MTKTLKLNLFCIFSLLFLLSSKQPVDGVIDTAVIKAGIAKITGRITSPNDANKNNIFVNITVSHPISGEYVKYNDKVKGMINGLL